MREPKNKFKKKHAKNMNSCPHCGSPSCPCSAATKAKINAEGSPQEEAGESAEFEKAEQASGMYK